MQIIAKVGFFLQSYSLKIQLMHLKPNLPPMKAVIFEIIFSLGARTSSSENKGALLENRVPLFLRTPKGKEFEYDPFIGSKLGLIALEYSF